MTGTASNVGSKDLPVPRQNHDSLPPPPPPKIVQDDFIDDSDSSSTKPRPLHLENISTIPASITGLQLPRTPTSPVGSALSAPPSPTIPDGKPKKSNPLTDLIDTEKTYVDQLTGIIRKVASAWSRSNLPPSELDTIFRSVEGIYKANRGLLAKLKEIGTSPSSPKALGDLLMRWIDDLEGPYTSYASKFITGFDVWDPVAGNLRLPTTLALFSSSNPPPIPPGSNFHPSEPPLWTLDALFLLPHGRLKYYKKLYSRLLKSTAPGRSDYKLLLGALEKLDKLLATIEGRSELRVGSQVVPPDPVVETEDEVVVDMRAQRESALPPPPPPSEVKELPSSEGESGSKHASSSSGSQDPASASTDRGSTSTLSAPISDLERRLSTARTLDLFTMKPREVKLQIVTPGLHYTRELRMSVDVIINFTPKSTGEETVYQRGHIFLLTDLFLICERMLPSERAQYGPNGPEMMLIFPPLAGKHLRVSEVPNSDTALCLTILRKEIMILTTPSSELRRRLLDEFRDCIDTAASLHSRAKQSPPPPIPSLPRSTSSPFPAPSPPSDLAKMSEPSSRTASPSYDNRRLSPPQRSASGASDGRWTPSGRPGDSMNRPGDPMNKLVLSPDAQVQHVSQRVPSLQEPLPGPLSLSRTSSTAETILDSSMERIGSGGPQTAFPHRQGGSFGPGPGAQVQPMPSSFNSGSIVSSQSYTPGQIYPPSRSTSFDQGPRVPSRGPPSAQFGPIPGQYPGPNPGPPGQHRGPPLGQYPGPPPNAQGYGPGGMPRPNPPYGGAPPRPPSEPHVQQNGHQILRKSQSSYSIASQYDQPRLSQLPPLPALPGRHPTGPGGLIRNESFDSLHAPQPRPLLPSAQMGARSISVLGNPSFQEPSPPTSPVQQAAAGPVTSTISAQMKCKVFLKQQHAQWKSLGSARLKLYRESPTNVKQLVVEAENKAKSILISTIVLTDGVERVGKTGVAVELSDKGARTGVVYMIQLRNEASAGGLFDSLLAGSDRS